jgi:twitching motility protein PilT
MVMTLLSTRQKVEELSENYQVDFSFGLAGVGRFRANAFYQRGALALALRVVPHRIRSLEELGAPAAATDLLNKPYGLVLVVGPTGSGKSTTLAGMIDRINETRPCHILTIEDPIEYLHHHKLSMVNQREVGTDVASFTDGLRSALREDPDVILLGEMRDLDSISITLTLAETGHLVFATLHTNDAAQALDRIVDVFPAEKRDQIQIQLSGSLQGVLSQRLLPAEAGGRVAAYEVLMANDAVRNLLREGKSRQIRNVMISGQQEGMQTIEMDLARLVAAGMISFDTAASISAYPKEIMSIVATQKALAGAGHHRRRRRSTGGVSSSASDRRRPDHRPTVERRLAMDAKQLPYKMLGGVVPCPGGWLILPGAPRRRHRDRRGRRWS